MASIVGDQLVLLEKNRQELFCRVAGRETSPAMDESILDLLRYFSQNQLDAASGEITPLDNWTFRHLKTRYAHSTLKSWARPSNYSATYCLIDNLTTSFYLFHQHFTPEGCSKSLMKELKEQPALSDDTLLAPWYFFRDRKNKCYNYLEPVAGSHLTALSAVEVSFSEEVLKKQARQLFSALEALHATGRVHQNIDSEVVYSDPEGNIYLDELYHPPVLEARIETRVADEDQRDIYLAPEALKKAVFDEAKSDVWGGGLVLLQGFLGKFPSFYPSGEHKIFNKILSIADLKRFPDSIELELKEKGASQECVNFFMCALDPDAETRNSVEELLAHPFLA
jgi:serine/threonine protein kinase